MKEIARLVLLALLSYDNLEVALLGGGGGADTTGRSATRVHADFTVDERASEARKSLALAIRLSFNEAGGAAVARGRLPSVHDQAYYAATHHERLRPDGLAHRALDVALSRARGYQRDHEARAWWSARTCKLCSGSLGFYLDNGRTYAVCSDNPEHTREV